MQIGIIRKCLVVGIIVLFVGASVVPCITGYDKDVETIKNKTDDYNNLMSQVIESGVISRDDWNEQDKLLPSDGVAQDWFGHSVSIDGDYAIIGACYDGDNGYNSGSAYVFKRSGATWTEQDKLLPSDGAAYDEFGWSVSIDGDYAIIGAYGDADNGTVSGSAYIFTRSGTIWTEQDKLLASDGAAFDFFGVSVSISGDYALIGACLDGDNGYESGSAYVFKRSGTTWTEQDKLLASDGAAFDFFGVSVSIDGDYAIIGAFDDDDNGAGSGSAYIFIRSGTTWTEQDKLLPSDGASGDAFGCSVSIDGDYAIIGAWADGDNGYESGSAYIFTRSGTTWTEQDKLLPSDGAAQDWFGVSVSIDGDYAIIGAIWDDDNGQDSGSAYIFTRSGTIWTEQDKLLPSDGAAYDYFGFSVSIDGGYAIIGALDDDDNGQDSGSAYIFTSVNSPPNEPSDPDPEDGETDVDVNQDLSWTCSDPDGDPLTYNVFFEADDTTPDVLVSENQSGTSYDPPGDLDFDTLYYWQIVAWDDNDASTEGPVWSFTTTDNNPPYEPSNPDPYNGETDVDVNRNLYWDGGDPDGDSVTYDVYFGTSSPPPFEASDIPVEYYDPGTMDWETMYYWRIIAEDENGATTTGPIWSFTTEDEPENFPPVISNENPLDDAMDVSIDLSELNVTIEDSEGDSFDWNIETSPNIGSSSGSGEGDGVKTCSVSDLQHNTTYTWYVNATDPDGSGRWTRKIYKFTTIQNSPPTAPAIDGEINGDTGKTYEYGFTSTDPDGDDIAEYIVNWGDGTGDETVTGPFASGDRQEATHKWTSAGDYEITAKAIDEYGLEGPEAQYSVTMPRGKLQLISTFLMRLLERFPNTFPLLQKLLLLMK